MSDRMYRSEATGCPHAEGRVIPSPIVREMLRALGVVTCPRCHQVTAIYGKRR